MNPNRIHDIKIEPDARRRPRRTFWLIFAGVALITGFAVFRMWPRTSDNVRIMGDDAGAQSEATVAPAGANAPESTAATTSTARGGANGDSSPANTGRKRGNDTVSSDVVLTVSGYIINRERIELSPRFMGTVSWLGVKKGDSVTNGQVVVLLDDSEYRARLAEIEGRLANAKVGVRRARIELDRAEELVASRVEMQKTLDDARLQLESALATVTEIEGQAQLMRIYLDWCVIRSPLDGVVLEKLVDPNELVVPQSFGGTRGPSTALIALADPKALQVEIDLNESDLPKVRLGQRCQVSPEAYLDRVYDGYVAEIAPEANRQKGTLQIKVQIIDPDPYLTPELSAKVDFLR
jgi:HlyD family secretion protein